VLRRTRDLDVLKGAERAAEARVEDLQRAGLAGEQARSARDAELAAMRDAAQGRYERARFATELRAFACGWRSRSRCWAWRRGWWRASGGATRGRWRAGSCCSRSSRSSSSSCRTCRATAGTCATPWAWPGASRPACG
jgi:hypothetical protein